VFACGVGGGDELFEGEWEGFGDVEGEDAGAVSAGERAGEGVDEDTALRGVDEGEAAREEGSDGAGEDVAGAPPRPRPEPLGQLLMFIAT